MKKNYESKTTILHEFRNVMVRLNIINKNNVFVIRSFYHDQKRYWRV